MTFVTLCHFSSPSPPPPRHSILLTALSSDDTECLLIPGLNLLGNSWGSPTPNPNPNPNPNPYASLFGSPYGLPNPLLNTSLANSNPNPFFNPIPLTTPAPPVEEDYNVKYKELLQELEEMGFTDRSANLAALIEADGELDKAITILFPDPNDAPKGDSS